MNENEILIIPIKDCGFSEIFLAGCRDMHFETIADIVFAVPAELIKKRGFSYTWLGELIDFLNKYQALHLLQPIPGKNRG